MKGLAGNTFRNWQHIDGIWLQGGKGLLLPNRMDKNSCQKYCRKKMDKILTRTYTCVCIHRSKDKENTISIMKQHDLIVMHKTLQKWQQFFNVYRKYFSNNWSHAQQHRKPQHFYEDLNHSEHFPNFSGSNLETKSKTINRIYDTIYY